MVGGVHRQTTMRSIAAHPQASLHKQDLARGIHQQWHRVCCTCIDGLCQTPHHGGCRYFETASLKQDTMPRKPISTPSTLNGTRSSGSFASVRNCCLAALSLWTAQAKLINLPVLSHDQKAMQPTSLQTCRRIHPHPWLSRFRQNPHQC